MSAMKEWAMLLAKHDLPETTANEIVAGYYNQFSVMFRANFPAGHACDILERHLNCRRRQAVIAWMRRQYKGATVTYEATHLLGRHWAVRPAGQLGTCGWHPIPWTVIYVTARSADEAVRKATQR